jgi:transcriptional regulator GlxA family with amidase domain
MPNIECHQRARRAGTRAARQAAVERIEAYLQAQAGATVPLADLCRLVGLSERSLRNAFYDVRGLGPKRSMVSERLHGAHQALREAAGRQITVTDVATGYGFFELGRFARAYREMFGEPPSATLGGAISHRPPPDGAANRLESAKCL